MNHLNYKSYLGKRGYILLKKHYTEEQLQELRDELTVKPFVNDDYGVPPEPFKVYSENKNKFYIPKCYGLEKLGEPEIFRLPEGQSIDVEFSGELRPNQIEPVNVTMKSLEEGGGGILSLSCASGKTVIGLYFISQLKAKTLIICHKEFLVNQWKERISQFIPDAKVGIIQQNKVEIEGYDICIGMLQSISMKDYALDTFDSFRFVIIDECHRIPCQSFSKALRKINSKYMLGLSATPNRKDGLTKVLKWYIGDIVYQTNQKASHEVLVERLIIDSDDESYNKELLNYRRKPNMPGMVNNITAHPKRTRNVIIEWIKELVYQDRKIILLSDRLNHLKDVHEIVSQEGICSVGYYVGGMKEAELKKSEDKTLILATFAMSSEGLDIPDLNTLILGSPKSDIVQSVGRILRKKHDYLQPLVVDLVDNFSVFKAQGAKRNMYYKKEGYEIWDIRITDEGDIKSKKKLVYEKKSPRKVVRKNVRQDFTKYNLFA